MSDASEPVRFVVEYWRTRRKLVGWILLIVVPLFGGVFAIYDKLRPLLESLSLATWFVVALLLATIVQLDLIRYLLANLQLASLREDADPLYQEGRFELEEQIAEYSIDPSEIEREKALPDGFDAGGLSVISTYRYRVLPVTNSLSFTYHEYRRNQNSALRWRGYDPRQIMKSFQSSRLRSHDRLEIVEHADGILKLRVVFDPDIMASDTAVEYIFVRRHTGSQFLSLEDIHEALAAGHAVDSITFCTQGRLISSKTDLLRLRAVFPPGYVPSRIRPRVTWNGEELPRLSEPLDVRRTERPDHRIDLELEVGGPHVGLVYAITWIPPRRQELRELTSYGNESG